MDTPTDEAPRGGFAVHLTNFEGPFDLLLSLISKHELEITEVALAEVTDEFIATVMAADGEWDLDGASGFLVVAATLLDLKAARLLPQGEVDDLEDIEALEARDLLFLRLLQYSAFKRVAQSFETMLTAPRRVPRDVRLEPHFAALLPELVWATDAEALARLAAHALEPHPTPAVPLGHLINPKVSVREQAAHITTLLQREKFMTFRAIVRDTKEMAVIVARFLALLELFRESLIAFDQVRSLSELTVRWTGGERDIDLVTDFDEEVHQDV
ncbi:MAG: segregation/condensation protein A [Demequinaceae bacterium]|nr:segregation/condensation protein A [Demequinaceae bacterium]